MFMVENQILSFMCRCNRNQLDAKMELLQIREWYRSVVTLYL